MIMRRTLVLAFWLMVAAVGIAQEAASPAPARKGEVVIPAPLGQTTPEGWFDDWNAAKAASRSTGRPILVLFTGSDWCHWCKVLRKEVLETPAFQEFARQKLILVFMDQPHSVKLPPVLRQTYQILQQTLKPGYGVPSLVLLSPEGKRLDAISGYDPELLSRLQKKLAP